MLRSLRRTLGYASIARLAAEALRRSRCVAVFFCIGPLSNCYKPSKCTFELWWHAFSTQCLTQVW